MSITVLLTSFTRYIITMMYIEYSIRACYFVMHNKTKGGYANGLIYKKTMQCCKRMSLVYNSTSTLPNLERYIKSLSATRSRLSNKARELASDRKEQKNLKVRGGWKNECT